YLDSAATSQKPAAVIDALSQFYASSNANVHRGAYTISAEATAAFEETRDRIARFLGGVDRRGVIFTRGTTESLNILAWAWGRRTLREGDEILLTEMEHHSNLVPWILVARETGARLRHIPVADDGTLQLERLDDLLTKKTRVVSVVHQSNVLGTINPVAEIVQRAKSVGALTIVDGAQSVPHMPVNVPELGCDALAFSAHKMLGPTGVGVLYARPDLLEAVEPLQGGGEMISEVRLDRATWRELPWKFEAGTPNVADVVAFQAALDYLENVGMESIASHGRRLAARARERLASLPFLQILGSADDGRRGGVISFLDRDIHPHDLATILDQKGIAIRAGHHCAQPLMRRFGLLATVRASFYLYNDMDDVEALIEGLKAAREYFGYADS
ncbi:MAG: SufS family cysteine desulfurase, partial [Candidatus Eisenbacteria bacterium]|nr:SufS family cysteine desulfurase [Candidatus Eisenbacteria bacterium]